MNRSWPIQYQSLYTYLTDWCDYPCALAWKIVVAAIAQDAAA